MMGSSRSKTLSSGTGSAPILGCRTQLSRHGALLLASIAALGWIGAAHAAEPKKGITVRSLLGKSVAEPTAEKFPDVASAIERFEKQDAKGACRRCSKRRS